MSKLFYNIFFKLILFSLFHLIYSYSHKCEISFYSDITFPKIESLSNGYKIMITLDGIYSFIPTLSRTINSYNFTENQKIISSNPMQDIFQTQICQFSIEDGGNEYVLC